MSERSNIGYNIEKSFKIGKTEIVLGKNEKAPEKFVTWQCSNGDDYFWGHYFDNEYDALYDYLDRCKSEVQQRDDRTRTPTKIEKER